MDGVEWARIEPAASGLQGRFARACELPRSLLATGTSMAPFDDYVSKNQKQYNKQIYKLIYTYI